MTTHSGKRLFACALQLFLYTSLAQATPSDARFSELEAQIRSLSAEVKTLKQQQPSAPALSHFRLPREVKICGESVPISDPEVSRRVEFEFLLMMQDRGQVALWMKRSASVFPRMERVFKKVGSCSDLKYLALIESGLRPTALSHAKAKGYWQFIPSTGDIFGLNSTSQWDQRSDFRRSTEAAVKYLYQLREQFGAWDLAMAAYNTGPTRLRNEIVSQKVENYWRLRLLREAERYVPRVVAAKVLMERLALYGFNRAESPGWQRPDVDYVRVTLKSRQRLNLKGVADGGGLDFRRLSSLNPELMGPILDGPFNSVLEVPKGKATVFRRWVKQNISRTKRSARKSKRAKRTTKKHRAKKKYYTVRNGDSLWRVSQKFGMSVGELRKLNGLRRRSVIKPGDRLKVKRR